MSESNKKLDELIKIIDEKVKYYEDNNNYPDILDYLKTSKKTLLKLKNI